MPITLEQGDVTRPTIGDGAAGPGRVGAAAVDDKHLDPGAVDEQGLHDGAGTREAYGADAGTNIKFDAHAVNGDKIADRSIGARHIRPGKVQGKHFRPAVVGGDHIDNNTIFNRNFRDRSIHARHIPPLTVWGFHIDYMSWRKISGGLNNLVAPGGFDGDVATRTETGVEWRTQGGYWEKIRSTPFIIGDGLPNAEGDGTVLRLDAGKNLDHYTNIWMRMERDNEATPTIMPRYMLDLGPQVTDPNSVNAQLLSGVLVGMRNSFGQVVFVRAASSVQLVFTATNPTTFPTVDPYIIKDVWGERNFSRITSSEDYDAAVDDILTPEERRVKEIIETIRRIINPPDTGGGGGGTPPPPPPPPPPDDDDDDTDQGTQIPDTDDTNDRTPPPPPIPIYRPTNPGTPPTPPQVAPPPPVGQPRPPTAPSIPAPPVAPTNPSPTPPPAPTPDPGDTDTDDNYRYEERPETPGGGISLPPISGIGHAPYT